MDLNWIIEKAKKCAFLIKEENFDEITSDKNYTPSAIYLLVAVAVLSILNTIISLFSIKASLNIVEIFILLLIVFLLTIAVMYIYAGIMHLLLKLVGGTAPFLKTIQVFIYGNTPNMLFGWIPYVGTLGGLVSLANFVIGCKRVHNISLLKSILIVVVLPIVIIAIIAIIVLVLFATSLQDKWQYFL